MPTSAIAAHIQVQVDRCRSPRRHAAIIERWARTQPALRGLSIDDIHVCCRRGTTEQNPLVAALIELHQAGDDDASTVLLSLCEPVIHGLTTSDGRSDRRYNVDHVDERVAAYWAGLGHVLASVTTEVPVHIDATPKVFLSHLGRLATERRRHSNASDRRRRRFVGANDRFVELTDALVESEQFRRQLTGGEVEDTALRSLELNQIADVVRAGLIDADKWHQLVEHRVTTTSESTGGASTSRERVTAHRTARRLAELVGHAA